MSALLSYPEWQLSVNRFNTQPSVNHVGRWDALWWRRLRNWKSWGTKTVRPLQIGNMPLTMTRCWQTVQI